MRRWERSSSRAAAGGRARRRRSGHPRPQPLTLTPHPRPDRFPSAVPGLVTYGMRPPCRAFCLASGRSSGSAPPTVSGFGPSSCAARRRAVVGLADRRVSSVAPRRRDEEIRISTETRINDRIRVPEVRLVGPNGEQVGIVRIEDALRLAQEAELDLVEVAAAARPRSASSWTTASSSTRARRRPGSPPQPAAHGDQGAEAPAEDRHPRLRDQEAQRRALPRGWQQGQGHHHVPRSRAVPPRAGVPAAAAARRGRGGAGYGRGGPEAGWAQHDHGDRSQQADPSGASPERPTHPRPFEEPDRGSARPSAWERPGARTSKITLHPARQLWRPRPGRHR